MTVFVRPSLLCAASALVLAGCSAGWRADGEATVETAPVEAVVEEALWPHDVSDLEPDPAVRYGVLENGMRYAILENDTPKETASLRLRFDVGSTAEADDQRGLAHFLEHMAFNGSTNVPEGEMIKILERFGLAFGPDTNAFTGFNQTQYLLELPSVDDELIDTGLFLMRETASELLLDPEAIDRERGVILSEERARNTFGFRRIVDILEFAAPNSIVTERLPIGDTEVIRTAPAERFEDLYRRYYTPERTTLIFVGDADSDVIETKIRKTFSGWTAAAEPGPEVEIPPVRRDRSVDTGFFYDPDVPTGLFIASLRPLEERPDTAAQRRLGVLRRLGNDILSRRFDKLSRAEDAPFLNASADYGPFLEAAEAATISLTTTPTNWPEALALGEQELRRALEFGFTEAELQEQIANFRAALENAAAQAGTRPNDRLASQIASAIDEERVFTTPAANLARFEAFAPQITVDMVEDAFREQWTGSGPLIHLSSSEAIAGAEAAVRAAYEASRQTQVEAPADAGALEFAYTDFGRPGRVVADSRIDDLGIRTVRFANHVRLNVKPTDFEEGAVRASIRVGGGELEFPMDLDGLGSFMASAFAQGGLEAHSADDLQSILAGKTVTLGLQPGEDAFDSTVRTTPADLELQMQLWAAYLTAPGYRPEAEARWAQTVDVVYQTLDATPSGIVGRDVERIIHGGDIRFGIGPEEALRARDFDELRPVLDRALSEGAIEIGVVGDVDEDEVIAAAAKTFGALDFRVIDPLPFEAARMVSFPETRSELTLTHAGQPNQALALTYWPTTDDGDVEEARALNVLRAALRLRLTDELREALGATYSPRALGETSDVFDGFGYLGASSEVEPQNIDQAFEIVDRIAADLAAGGLTEDELQRARQPILERIEEQREDNGAWLARVGVAQTQPDELDRFRTLEAGYRALTTADVTAAAERYLRDDAALRIRIVSENTAED